VQKYSDADDLRVAAAIEVVMISCARTEKRCFAVSPANHIPKPPYPANAQTTHLASAEPAYAASRFTSSDIGCDPFSPAIGRDHAGTSLDCQREEDR